MLINIIRHHKNQQQALHVCYVDITKAYDSMEHWFIRETLSNLGFSTHFQELMTDVYSNNTINVITPFGLTGPVQIQRGVRQGCSLSPILFILCLEIGINWINDTCDGVKINNSHIRALAFCDDIALIAKSKWQLQNTFSKLNQFMNVYGFKIGIDEDRTKTVYTHSQADQPQQQLIHSTRQPTNSNTYNQQE